MNASNTIQAAIDKLNSIRRYSGLVSRCVDPRDLLFRADDDTDEDSNSFSFGLIVGMDDEDIAEGVVTLPRTVEAQLAVLADWLDTYGPSVSASCISPTDPVFTLAHAILGSDE